MLEWYYLANVLMLSTYNLLMHLYIKTINMLSRYLFLNRLEPNILIYVHSISCLDVVVDLAVA